MSRRRVLNLGPSGIIPVDTLHEMYLDLRDGTCLTVYQSKTVRSLGSWVYDAAASLAKYIETEDFKKRCLDGNLAGKQLIEIGAGTGVVGLVAAHYGADSLLTDMESLVPLINYNIEKNQHILTGKAVGQTLCWGDQETYGSLPHPDFLVLANCVYYEGSLDQLAQTVDTLSGSKTVVLACYEERSKDISKLLQKWHELIGQKFSVTPVPADNLGLANVESFVRIVIMRRK